MIKTVIIGAGGIAKKHAEAINRIPNLEAIGVIDPNPVNADRIAKLCNTKVVATLEEIIDQVHMVHLLTPPSKRVAYAEMAMKAGKHVLCEKPIAVSLEDAYVLLDLSGKSEGIFMTAFNMRFRPGYLKWQDDVLSGRLGDVLSVWSQRIGPGSGFNAPLGESWRTDPTLVCGMSIESLSHDIDMIRALGLEIKRVSAKVRGTRPELPAFDNNAQVFMELYNGGSVTINASWSSYLPMCSRGVIGTKGTSVISGDGFFDFMDHRIKTAGMQYEQITRINDPFDSESYVTENRHFVECIEKGIRPLTTAECGVKALKVSLAILESSRTNLTIEL